MADECSAFAPLLHPVSLRQHIQHWLAEDSPSFDYGGFVVGETEETAILLCKSRGVLAGIPFFDAIFEELGCKVEWLFPEGEQIQPATTVAKVIGKVNKILLGERVALNCITRASGVATKARNLAKLKEERNWNGEIAGTRKTTPGFRMVEKYALLVGGVSTHRYDLSSMIMLKDNHIWTAGSVKRAVGDARKVGGFSIKIEVECRSIDEAREAATAGADVVMLDNFEPDALHKTAAVLKQEFPHLLIEGSGGVKLGNITQYFGPNIDVISMGSLTQGYETVNFSLKVLKEGHDPLNPSVTI
ncbi:nicotinate-nucleotide pyrophosphorylase [carboxylating]-like isoform X1 [Montipora capricornis]|uniref:nicotinate-nucleotide pyrophosphorylase [carboxylating]-like isoform X1 n=1 Tax=Montipora capricornis TaxID=246305 RepID=UPI0035F17FBE